MGIVMFSGLDKRVIADHNNENGENRLQNSQKLLRK